MHFQQCGRCRLTGFAALLVMGLAHGATPDDSALKVLDCMRANLPPTESVREFVLEASDKSGTARTYQGHLYSKREKAATSDASVMRVILRMIAPHDLYGAAYLIREKDDRSNSDMYFYLPSLQRVRHVTGAAAGASFLDTDLSYDDIRQLETSFEGSAATLDTTELLGQRPSSVLLLKPLPSEKSGYQLIRVWADQATCVPLKAEFYQGKTVRKRLTVRADSLRQSGAYWYPAESEIRDLKNGTRTVLRVNGVTSGGNLPGSAFYPATFFLGN